MYFFWTGLAFRNGQESKVVLRSVHAEWYHEFLNSLLATCKLPPNQGVNPEL